MSPFQDRTPIVLPRNGQNFVFVVLLTLMFWIFFGNLCDGLLLLHSRRHTRGTRLYVPILNIIPNLFCAIMCAYVAMQRSWPGFASCSVIMKLDTVALSFGTTAIIGILFIRVYYAWMRHRWLLYLGSVMLFINFSVCISSLVAVTPYIDSNGSCLETIDHYWTLAKFSTDIIVNVTLSGLYLYVLGQAFRAGFSTSLYRELRQEGFIATFLVIISSTTAAVFVIIDIAPGNALYVYGIDILLNATLINRMLCRRRNSSNQPQTSGELQRINSVDE